MILWHMCVYDGEGIGQMHLSMCQESGPVKDRPRTLPVGISFFALSAVHVNSSDKHFDVLPKILNSSIPGVTRLSLPEQPDLRSRYPAGITVPLL